VRSITFDAEVTGVDQGQAVDRIADFAAYPDLVDAVRQVDMLPSPPGGPLRSRWAVAFRGGLMRWSESDWVDRDTGVIRFEQDDGDLDVFRGQWRVSPTGDGVRVVFAADFDFGVPSIADILEPVASRMLTENIESILRGLFGGRHVRISHL
jgi:ribosome-associated toxin RatA of RatAB toxin-antitoxin module